MSFGGLFDDGGAGIPFSSSSSLPPGVLSQQRGLLTHSLTKSMFSSPGLSLGLNDLEGQRERNLAPGASGGGFDSARRDKDDENDSRSGSDNLDGFSGDDLDLENPRKKKRYHRHTPQQIQELEALFKECPHPDEKQRAELSRRLNLEARQVKFWFQNRRTQMKTQLERHENTILRQENDKLRAEGLSIREALRSPMCANCGGPGVLGEISLEEQHLRIENARLKDELDRVCALAGKFLGKPISALATPMHLSMPNSSLELGVGNNGFAGLRPLDATNLAPASDFSTCMSNPTGPAMTTARSMGAGSVGLVDRSEHRFMLELALTAMDELVKLAQMEDPLWIPTLDGSGKVALNYDEYRRNFPRCIPEKPVSFVSEATRETGVVIINSIALVGALMDTTRWTDMFPSMVAKTTTTEVISSDMSGTRNGSLQLMNVELQVLSPLVPIREANFLRFCKQLSESTWAIVDVSVDGIRDNPSAKSTAAKCRRLPSGCLVQDMPNGYSKVTWVEHVEYDEDVVHPLFRPLFRSGVALGAHRWISTLRRQCESLTILMSPTIPPNDGETITPAGRRSMLKLAQRMTDNFCAGVCASSTHDWNKLTGGVSIGEDVRVMTRQSVADPGEPPGVVLSAATSVWLPVAPQRLFDFLRDEKLRSQWDILSNGGPMQDMARIPKGQEPGNAVTLLRASTGSANQSMLILQETCTDPSGSLVVYAPVDVPAMHLVMSGGDSAYVALLPSGFAILPDGNAAGGFDATDSKVAAGSLLTVAFQILVNSQPTAKLTLESVETVNNLISCTVQKIKAALGCDT